MLIIKYQEACF